MTEMVQNNLKHVEPVDGRLEKTPCVRGLEKSSCETTTNEPAALININRKKILRLSALYNLSKR